MGRAEVCTTTEKLVLVTHNVKLPDFRISPTQPGKQDVVAAKMLRFLSPYTFNDHTPLSLSLCWVMTTVYTVHYPASCLQLSTTTCMCNYSLPWWSHRTKNGMTLMTKSMSTLCVTVGCFMTALTASHLCSKFRAVFSPLINSYCPPQHRIYKMVHYAFVPSIQYLIGGQLHHRLPIVSIKCSVCIILHYNDHL